MDEHLDEYQCYSVEFNRCGAKVLVGAKLKGLALAATGMQPIGYSGASSTFLIGSQVYSKQQWIHTLSTSYPIVQHGNKSSHQANPQYSVSHMVIKLHIGSQYSDLVPPVSREVVPSDGKVQGLMPYLAGPWDTHVRASSIVPAVKNISYLDIKEII